MIHRKRPIERLQPSVPQKLLACVALTFSASPTLPTFNPAVYIVAAVAPSKQRQPRRGAKTRAKRDQLHDGRANRYTAGGSSPPRRRSSGEGVPRARQPKEHAGGRGTAASARLARNPFRGVAQLCGRAGRPD